MYLDALLPPGNIAAVLTGLKRELFRQEGLVSSRALPPLIPLGWHRELLPRRDSGRPGSPRDFPAAAGGTGFCLEPRFREFRDSFYLPVEFSPPGAGLAFPAPAESPESPPFSPFPGIHMGSLEEAGTLPACPEVSREALRWQMCRRVLFRVRWSREAPWWNFLELEEVL